MRKLFPADSATALAILYRPAATGRAIKTLASRIRNTIHKTIDGRKFCHEGEIKVLSLSPKIPVRAIPGESDLKALLALVNDQSPILAEIEKIAQARADANHLIGQANAAVESHNEMAAALTAREAAVAKREADAEQREREAAVVHREADAEQREREAVLGRRTFDLDMQAAALTERESRCTAIERQAAALRESLATNLP